MRHPLRILFAALVLAALPASAQDVYKIDPVHSEVAFSIRHLLAKTSGRFTKFSGEIHLDNKDITKSTVAVTIDTASINTDSAMRDADLRSPKFFDVAKYPTITFTSTAVKEVSKGKLEITGTFTMHGVTKQITFPITNEGTGHGMQPGSVVAGFIDGALTLDRDDYGISTYDGLVGRHVAITLNVEADKVSGK